MLNPNRTKMKGSINLFVITGILATVLGGSYLYLDYKADSKASETMISLVNDAKSQGAELSYSSVDASPITQSVKITDLVIIGNEQEPDIRLGQVVIDGFSWQDLDNQSDALPTAMSVDIKGGKINFKKSMMNSDPELHALMVELGDTISFSTHLSYKLSLNKNQLNIILTQHVQDNFIIDAALTLGNIAWLTEIKVDQTKVPNEFMYEAMKSTLNDFTLSYENNGFIEKIRAVVMGKTGKTNEQLVEESIVQLEQLQMVSASQWGDLFTPFIDEVIEFSRVPKQLKLDISPKQPLTGQNFMMAFMGGETSLITLLENAQISLKAN